MSAKRSKRISSGDGWTFNPADDDRPKSTSSGKKIVRLRMEKRKGKPTTILYDLEGVPSMKELAKQLKTLVSAGGTTKNGKIEIQGEHRDKFRVYLSDEGYEVKG
ncbi:MAG: translation initiation factor [Candidatus Marinimicrobia bacterium]|nr:translation initiation factor [Candidatus Neomarinimicrobiota bacterium]MCF7851565.1 translation initiation factor [Candidatus Neomarinimicrobiota bacterium]MCF7904685.1 translation initiation factor [Candidatus Neomarinimicrobiota bacterium]